MNYEKERIINAICTENATCTENAVCTENAGNDVCIKYKKRGPKSA